MHITRPLHLPKIDPDFTFHYCAIHMQKVRHHAHVHVATWGGMSCSAPFLMPPILAVDMHPTSERHYHVSRSCERWSTLMHVRGLLLACADSCERPQKAQACMVTCNLAYFIIATKLMLARVRMSCSVPVHVGALPPTCM
jgi:hypothetical protein